MNLKYISVLVLMASSFVSATEPPKLNCDVGPVNKSFGGTNWLVYSCNDKSSIVFITAPGSKAMPFVFINTNGKLSGEGTGNKELTDDAFTEIKDLTSVQIERLIAETKNIKEL